MVRRFLTFMVLGVGISVVFWATHFSRTVMAGPAGDANVRGRKLYVQYCASCHGLDGTGHGPAAPSLKDAPADLTAIPKENGKYPALHVQYVISGEKEITAHGTRTMPVWGKIFRKTEGEMIAKADIYALQKYIESIQKK